MQATELAFIDEVLGIDTDLEAFEERENKKRAALDEAFSMLEGEKDSIRQAMQVRLVDSKGKEHEKAISKRGQEHSIDTFKATREGKGLTDKDMKQVGEAMSKIVKAARSVLDKKNPDGSLLFESPQELAQELFSPLVREGILPENFVLDDYSEVQQLLNETFKSYKQTSDDSRKEKELSEAEEKSNYYGAGSGTDRFGAVMKSLTSLPDKALNKIGLDKDKRKVAEMLIATGKASFDTLMAGMTVDKWQTDPNTGKPRIEGSFDRCLHPENYEDAKPGTDSDELRIKYTQDYRSEKINNVSWLNQTDKDNIIKLLNVQEDKNFVGVKEGLTGYGGTVVDVITKLALPGDKATKLTELLEKSHHEYANVEAAQKAAKAIDGKLVALLDQHVRPGVGKALAGAYAGAVDCEAIGEAVAKTKPDDQEAIAQYAAAFEAVFARGVDPSLAAEGKAIAKEFVGNAQGSNLQKSLQKDPTTAFDPLVLVAERALGKVLSGLAPDKKETIDAGVLKGALAAVVKAIDEALCAELKKQAGANAAEAFAGLFAAEVDRPAAVKAAAKTQPDGAAVVAALADGLHAAFVKAAPNPSDKAFVIAGKALSSELRKTVNAGQLATDLTADATTAFVPVVKDAQAAIAAALSRSKGLLKQLANVDTVRAIASKSAFPDDGEEALNELEQSEAEIKEYERQLVLIDEGGISAAELKTIEKLIEQLQRDKIIADMVVAAGNALTSLGTTTTTIVGAATKEVTDILVGEIAGPLKAAKLIIKFGVAMKKAHDRRILFEKFDKTLKLSKKSVSSLQSTVQGFFDNKVEQITFRAIEDALTLVQIAAAILGSVPEPITLAVGKTIGAIASAGESTHKVSEMIYTEVKLAEGWKTTLAAIRNPRDRATGLAALRLNPTLGMHAIAWAGMEKQPPDPIARMLLAELGLNEQTLAVSGTERKVRAYLETLLSEDRQLLDPDKVAPKWMPKDVSLTGADWAIATTRASRDAKPALVESTERTVLAAFKLTDQHDLADLEKRANDGEIEEVEWRKILKEAADLAAVLRAYSPVSSDGQEHADMANLAAAFLKLASERERELNRLVAVNAKVQAHDVDRVTDRLNERIKAVDGVASSEVFAEFQAAFQAACEQLREVQLARLDTDNQIKPLYTQLLTKSQALSKALAAMEVWQDESPDWNGDLAGAWLQAKKKARYKGKTGLSDLIKAAKQAVADLATNKIQKNQATAALQAVIDNIDQQLPNADPGLALYLRKMKSGAKKLQP